VAGGGVAEVEDQLAAPEPPAHREVPVARGHVDQARPDHFAGGRDPNRQAAVMGSAPE